MIPNRTDTDYALSYALPLALRHKVTRKMRAPHLGAYLSLILAALEEGLNWRTAQQLHLQAYARCNPVQWIAVREVVLEALEKAMPEVEAVYSAKLVVTQKRALNAKRLFAKAHKGTAEPEALNAARVALLSEQSAAPTILQPQKAPRYKPQNTDMVARNAAIATKKSGSDAPRLTD